MENNKNNISKSYQERKSYILDYLHRNEFADITQLSKDLSVSEMTIRRDFAKLEKEKKLLRVLGGAISIPRSTYEAPLDNRLVHNYNEKRTLGKYAASLIEKGDVIALDASTTVLTMLEFIDKPITMVTNCIQTAAQAIHNQNIEVVLLGGSVRKKSASTVGFETVSMMKKYFVDKVFFSSKAINLEHGLSDATVGEAEVKKAMISNTTENFLLMDHSKIDTIAFYHVCPLNSLQNLIISQSEEFSDAQTSFLQHCEKSGIEVHRA